MDQIEVLFLQFIWKFTADDIRDAITTDVDLGDLVIKEYGEDVLKEARNFAMLYDVTHPGRKQVLATDPDRSALAVLDWLKKNRPDLGFEIEAYTSYPTAATLGLNVVGNAQIMPAPEGTRGILQGDVGFDWLKRNLLSLARVLL